MSKFKVGDRVVMRYSEGRVSPKVHGSHDIPNGTEGVVKSVPRGSAACGDVLFDGRARADFTSFDRLELASSAPEKAPVVFHPDLITIKEITVPASVIQDAMKAYVKASGITQEIESAHFSLAPFALKDLMQLKTLGVILKPAA